MLREALRRGEQENVFFDAVRADAARLPFEDESVDFVHTGAALHCWTKPQDGLAEVLRVLVPGGRFFTTVFLDGAFQGGMSNRAGIMSAVRPMDPVRLFSPSELRYLLQAAGFSNISVQVSRYCGIARCEKADG
jgi:ubiquinone/menaquinone biosynthesis C-methylase UbiE